MPNHRYALLGFVLLVASTAGDPGHAQGTNAAGQGQPPPATDAQGQGTLSDKLSTTNGVIHPQTNVDPEMGKPPPDPGTTRMPVIPPAGSPGGAPGAQPK